MRESLRLTRGATLVITDVRVHRRGAPAACMIRLEVAGFDVDGVPRSPAPFYLHPDDARRLAVALAAASRRATR